MNKMLIAWLLASGLFIGMLILLEAGRRLGIQRRARDPEGAQTGTGVVDGAVFALVGLLIEKATDSLNRLRLPLAAGAHQVE